MTKNTDHVGDKDPRRQAKVVERKGEWFNVNDSRENYCYRHGGHQWGKTLFSGDPDEQLAYHICNQCGHTAFV